jgi:FHA domain
MPLPRVPPPSLGPGYNRNLVRPLIELRELAADGAMPLDSDAVLLVEFWKGGTLAREFRTSTLSLPEVIPPLLGVTSDPATQVVPLEKSSRNPYDGFLFLGRASTCDVVIRDPSISKSHAVIEPQGTHWRLRDNRSHNGTWHNGERLKEGERVELASGDVIVLGSYPVYFMRSEDLIKILARVTMRPPRF